VHFAGLGVETVNEAGEIPDEEQAGLGIDGDGGDAAMNAAVLPDERGLSHVASLGGVDANQSPDAFAVFRDPGRWRRRRGSCRKPEWS
jgi:hypothetical protein